MTTIIPNIQVFVFMLMELYLQLCCFYYRVCISYVQLRSNINTPNFIIF